MAGTKEGGLKARATNKAKYGRDYYRRIGSIGGRNGHTGGFASNPELAKIAGAKGGRRSKRGKALKDKDRTPNYYAKDDDILVRKAEERKRLKALIRALEAEELYDD